MYSQTLSPLPLCYQSDKVEALHARTMLRGPRVSFWGVSWPEHSFSIPATRSHYKWDWQVSRPRPSWICAVLRSSSYAGLTDQGWSTESSLPLKSSPKWGACSTFTSTLLSALKPVPLYLASQNYVNVEDLIDYETLLDSFLNNYIRF